MRQMIKLLSRTLSKTILFSCISSFAILLCIALQNVENVSKVFVFLVSLTFWVGLFFEQLFFWRSNALRKKIEDTGQFRKLRGKSGIISFLRTKWSFIADFTFVVSLMIYLVLLAGNWGKNIIQFIILFFIVLSFRLHCILNGKTFRYNLYLKKRRSQL